MRKELFGDMSNLEIVGEVTGSIAFLVLVVGFVHLMLVLS